MNDNWCGKGRGRGSRDQWTKQFSSEEDDYDQLDTETKTGSPDGDGRGQSPARSPIIDTNGKSLMVVDPLARPNRKFNVQQIECNISNKYGAESSAKATDTDYEYHEAVNERNYHQFGNQFK